MQLSGVMGIRLPCSCFNPHPARRPDANTVALTGYSTGDGSFNPHPARRPDATVERRSTSNDYFIVSILIRPEGRMQLRGCGWRLPLIVFQSSSGQKAGCNQVCPVAGKVFPGFQSSSGQKAGCNACDRKVEDGDQFVSILIRPEGRMQRLYLNFLSVLREPPDTGLPICFHCPDHSLPPATIQLRTRTSKLQWLRHWVRVRRPAVP